MYGYILANKSALTPEQLERYRGCYCGLCRALKERYGLSGRLTLNFDMTFLIILLSSMYEPKEFSGSEKCLVHPLKKQSWWRSIFTEYAADMNIALAYHKCLDDWSDDKSLLGLSEARLLKTGYAEAEKRWPRQCGAIEDCMARLAGIESSGDAGPDDAANCFGVLMGEIFACREDSWAGAFRAFGQALGRFVYMMDACVDLARDKKRGSYNPLIAMGRENLTEPEKKSMLNMLIGECAQEFEKLPLLQDVDIMRNILYSGVWTQYELASRKAGGGKDDKRSV